jgi:putative transposase
MMIRDRELREMLADVVESSAMSLLDPDRLQAIAEDLRVVERRRGYDAGLVAVSVVVSALQRSTDTEGRLADARRVYEMLGGGQTTESGFRKIARKIAPVLRELLNRRLATVAAGVAEPELRGRLSALGDVLIPDGCAFKLANTLAQTYAGTGQPSELKFHAVYSVRAGSLVALSATAGAVHDNDGFAPQTWVPGSLYIWDLGYNDYGRVVAASKAGALVLQRLKAGANPKVIASYGPGGHRRELRAEDGGDLRLDAACAMGMVHRQHVLDLDVELREAGEAVVVRVVCVPFGGEDRYYLTTLARADFSPHDVAELYRLRWEIELFFRGLKGATRLDEVRRLENAESLHAIVYGSLLAALLARDITAKLNELAASRAEVPASASAEAFPPGAAEEDGTGLQPCAEASRAADLLRSRLAARSRLSPNHRAPHCHLES